ncbi:MAG: hypothetical protein EZS28_042284 [Streblomastix strix]|uniref:Uncharacterized protein n=1 Tax=Streblomastix strix TaxID=222440 RepID=A0A5J4TWD3_9EUKA|nr:MAG: hypothetical protein EZS28_042284 [Streblomastix strix]
MANEVQLELLKTKEELADKLEQQKRETKLARDEIQRIQRTSDESQKIQAMLRNEIIKLKTQNDSQVKSQVADCEAKNQDLEIITVELRKRVEYAEQELLDVRAKDRVQIQQLTNERDAAINRANKAEKELNMQRDESPSDKDLLYQYKILKQDHERQETQFKRREEEHQVEIQVLHEQISEMIADAAKNQYGRDRIRDYSREDLIKEIGGNERLIRNEMNIDHNRSTEDYERVLLERIQLKRQNAELQSQIADLEQQINPSLMRRNQGINMRSPAKSRS